LHANQIDLHGKRNDENRHQLDVMFLTKYISNDPSTSKYESCFVSSRKMKLCSSNVLVCLLAAIMCGTVTNCAHYSPRKSIFVGYGIIPSELNQVANNAKCPFAIKPIYIWIPMLNSGIRIINITCKNSAR